MKTHTRSAKKSGGMAPVNPSQKARGVSNKKGFPEASYKGAGANVVTSKLKRSDGSKES